MKNILLDISQNFDKMSDSEKEKINDNVRKQFDNIIHGNPPKTEREKEIDKLAREELEETDERRKLFVTILSIGIITSVEDIDFLY